MINTILIILQQACMHLSLLIGAYISIALMKVPDLSIETAFMCGGLSASMTIVALQNMPLVIVLSAAIIAALIGGALVGVVSSSITHYGKLPHLLSSIITFGIFHGVVQMITNPYISLSGSINPLSMHIVSSKHPELIVLMCTSIVVIALMYLFLKTQLGYSYAVFGNNPRFFRNYGISTGFIFLSGIILSNGLAGLSGYLCAQSNGFAEMNMGIGKVLMCITSLILGKTLIAKKVPSVVIPVIGCFSYFALQQLLLKIGFNLRYFTMFQAFLLLGILILYYRKKMHEPIEHLGV